MPSNPLKGIDKISGFIEKFTGSNYNYSAPTGEINANYKEVGEIFGIPIFVDTGAQYESEFLDFPTLSDILNSIANTGVQVETSVTECTACMTVTFAIPLIQYPPIIICLVNPACKEEEENNNNNNNNNSQCVSLEELERLSKLSLEDLEKEGLKGLPALCVPDQPDYDLPKLEPGEWLERRWVGWNKWNDTTTPYISNWYYHNADTWVGENDQKSLVNTIDKEYFANGVWHRVLSYWSDGYAKSKYANYVWTISIGFSRERYPYEENYPDWPQIPSIHVYRDSMELRKMPGEIPIPPKEKPPTGIIETPSPPPDMNACCNDIKKLLARNEKMLKEIHKVINPEQFFKGDVQVPNCWIYPGHNPSPVKADDIPDAISMILRMLDRRIGYMPQAIQIKDANPDIEGDQGKSLIVNSLADLCKHIFEFQINAGREEARVNKALLKMGSATMFEAGTTHQLAIVIERMIQAITEYLDFEATQKKEKFKMYFDPTKQLGKDNLEQHLDGLIKGHNQPIEVMEWKGGSSEKDKLNEILQKVSLCAAALSTTKPLEETIQEAKDLARVERMLIVKELQDRDGIPDLKEFNDDAEKGYPSSNRSPSVKANPYGFGSGEPKLKRTTSKSKKPKYTNKAKKQ